MRCSICGTDNPDKNQFCSSCGKPLQKPQPLTNTLPAGAGQTPVPAAPKGSGMGLVLLMGGLLFLIAVIAVGIFVILPLFEEEPASWGEPGISSVTPGLPADLTHAGNSPDAADSHGSLVSGTVDNPGSSPVTATATRMVSPPVQGSSTPSDDPVIGTWEIGSTGMQMQFDTDGAAILRDPPSGYSSTGSWERVSDGRYRLRSASGAESPVLISDPIAGILYFEDYSSVFIRKG